MKNAELVDETLILPRHENSRKEPSNRAAKKIMFALKDVPKELRKKEARKPLFLIRYE